MHMIIPAMSRGWARCGTYQVCPVRSGRHHIRTFTYHLRMPSIHTPHSHLSSGGWCPPGYAGGHDAKRIRCAPLGLGDVTFAPSLTTTKCLLFTHPKA